MQEPAAVTDAMIKIAGRVVAGLARLWALPWTLAGLFVGSTALATGGGGRCVEGVLEFHGGLVAWLLRHAAGGASAMTLGHVILGRTRADLNRAREHEHVHVRQYERWGLMFIPAYGLCSAWLWLRGRRPYWDNPFEREAYGRARCERRRE
jgi:hypothetical protein